MRRRGRWQALTTLAPERLLALRHSATIESIGSSTRIEGVKLSNVEVERLLASLNQTSFATRNEQEVAGYARVMERVFESWLNIALNENHLSQLHAELLQFSDKDTRYRGNTRPTRITWPPSVRMARCSVSFSSPPFRHSVRDVGVVGLAPGGGVGTGPMAPISAHWRIHRPLSGGAPVSDGNDRLPRVLTTLLLQAGYAYFPYSSLESMIETNKGADHLTLRQTQTTLKEPEPS